MPIRESMSVCSKCHRMKPDDEFRWRTDTGKRRSYCIECQRAQWHGQNVSDRHRASSRRYYHAIKRDQNIQLRGCKGSQGDAELKRALARLYRGVRTGNIIKPDHCQICGEDLPRDKIQAHLRNHDTSKQDVLWVCVMCNRAVERCERKSNNGS